MKIFGPKTYTEYELGEVRFSIFGENHHIEKEDKYLFNDFLKLLLINNPDKTYNFFAELGYINKDIKERRKIDPNSMLSKIEADFFKYDHPYKNLRAHYTDIRNKFSDLLYDSEYSKLFFYLINVSKFNDDRLLKDFDISKYISFTNPIVYLNDQYEKVLAYLNDKILQKELSKCIYSHEINTYIKSLIRMGKKRILLYISNNISLFNEKNFTVKNLMGYIKYYNLYIELSSNLMDIYTLARMFKIFDNNSICENIIFYGGNYHANVYRKFLELIGAKKTIDLQGNNYVEFTDEVITFHKLYPQTQSVPKGNL
jgi:hypothetical protein